ncbi:MAG: Lrp/AsnC family transcriptional regulator [Candidatus Omnitrophota bacterium]
MKISAIDRQILNHIQEDIPFVPEPFKVLSKNIGIEEEELIKRIKRLKSRGLIRTFAAGLSHRKLGYKGTLIALKIDPSRVEAIAAELSNYDEVTHCYLRKGQYNLYLVLICQNKEKMQEFLGKLRKLAGEENILNLVTKKQFKLKTRLKI